MAVIEIPDDAEIRHVVVLDDETIGVRFKIDGRTRFRIISYSQLMTVGHWHDEERR